MATRGRRRKPPFLFHALRGGPWPPRASLRRPSLRFSGIRAHVKSRLSLQAEPMALDPPGSALTAPPCRARVRAGERGRANGLRLPFAAYGSMVLWQDSRSPAIATHGQETGNPPSCRVHAIMRAAGSRVRSRPCAGSRNPLREQGGDRSGLLFVMAAFVPPGSSSTIASLQAQPGEARSSGPQLALSVPPEGLPQQCVAAGPAPRPTAGHGWHGASPENKGERP